MSVVFYLATGLYLELAALSTSRKVSRHLLWAVCGPFESYIKSNLNVASQIRSGFCAALELGMSVQSTQEQRLNLASFQKVVQ